MFDSDGIKNSTVNNIGEIYEGEFEYYLSREFWLDIMNKDVNKGNEVKVLQEKFRINKSETMVFGGQIVYKEGIWIGMYG